MGNNIPEIAHSCKAKDIALIAIILLLGLFSFGLGRLSGSPIVRPSVALCGSVIGSLGSPQEEKGVVIQQSGTYVASKNGSVYHLPWCSGAQRISEKNKVWFATKNDAEGAGYRPAANCPGI